MFIQLDRVLLSSSAFRCKRLFKIEGPRKSSLRKKLQNGSNKRGFGTCQRPLLSWIIHFAPALSKIDIPYVIGRCRVGSNVCVVFLTNAKFCGARGSTHLDLKKITLFSPSFLDLLIQSQKNGFVYILHLLICMNRSSAAFILSLSVFLTKTWLSKCSLFALSYYCEVLSAPESAKIFFS